MVLPLYSVYIYPDDDLQDIRYAIEDFVDGELAADEDDSENITRTEVVGFKYDIETGQGEFEATIFFANDINESLNENYKAKTMSIKHAGEDLAAIVKKVTFRFEEKAKQWEDNFESEKIDNFVDRILELMWDCTSNLENVFKRMR